MMGVDAVSSILQLIFFNTFDVFSAISRVILPPFQSNLYVSHLLSTIALPFQTGFTSEFPGLDRSSYCGQ